MTVLPPSLQIPITAGAKPPVAAHPAASPFSPRVGDAADFRLRSNDTMPANANAEAEAEAPLGVNLDIRGG